MGLKQDEMHKIVPCLGHAVGNYTLHDLSPRLHMSHDMHIFIPVFSVRGK